MKFEINFLKRQLREIKSAGLVLNFEAIERIKHDKDRPEINKFKIQFNVVVKELKVIFHENFDYREVLKPINVREDPDELTIIIEDL